MARALAAVARACARWRWVVIGVWLLLAVGHVVALSTLGSTARNNLSLPGTDSQAAIDLLAEQFPPQQNGASPIVFHAGSGAITDPANAAAVQRSVAAILAVPHVVSAPDPTANPQAGLISVDGTTAFTSVLLDVGSGDLTEETAQAVVAAAEPARAAGLQVEAGGAVGSVLSDTDDETSEVIGILAAMVILSLTFGSIVAMGMPILMAMVGLLVSLGLVDLAGRFLSIPTTGPKLATMIGLGVGIDYALFLVTRHLDNRRTGMATRDSIVNAVSTAGSAVVFAGGTVMIALLSLGVAGIPLVSALGLATALAVLGAVLAAITLMPAMLAVAGEHVDALRLPRWLHRPPRTDGRGLTDRWAGFATRRPWRSVAIALLILVPLAIPLFSLRLGQEDIGVTSTTTTERRAFDLLSEEFGPGYNGPLLVAVSLDPVATASPLVAAQYDQANALKDSLTSQQQSLEQQADDLTAQKDALEQQQAALESQAADLTTQQAQLEKQATSLTAQQQALEREAAGLAAQKAGLERQERSLTRERAALQRKKAVLVADARARARELVDLRRVVTRLDGEISALDAAIGTASDPADTARLVAERAVAMAARSAAREDIRSVRADLRDLRSSATSLARQAESVGRQSRALARRADELSREAAGLRGQAVSLQRQASSLQKQADTLQAQGDDLTAEGETLQSQADALQTQADALTVQQAELEAQAGQATQLQLQLTTILTKAGGDLRGTDPRLVALQDALAVPSGVRLVAPPSISTSGSAATFTVIPETRPADESTADLVVQVRDGITAPAAQAGLTVYVGGSTAANVDLANLITGKLPLVILTVLVLSFLLLMVAFRSLLVPLQATINNLLCVAASFGVLVAVFQWGWGLDLVGLDDAYGTVPIASYVPLMMFAALFGLSTDYEVFFVSSVQRAAAQGAPAREAVRRGLASSARVIVSAALIMICVFGSFILEDDPVIKQFGVGLSVAVLLAGSMVLLLAPALLSLFGTRVFWVPRPLDRVLPHLDLEGDPTTTGAVAPTSAQAAP